MNAQAPISDTGSARAGISVAEADLRKTKMTTTTSKIDRPRVDCTSSIDWRIDTDRSLRLRLDRRRQLRLVVGNLGLDVVDHLDGVGVDWRKTASTIDGSWPDQPAICLFSTKS